ncbi:MAG: response regulator transcription factor [Anaerolineales bacterium]|nr:response regulator transcription factor [Anaerolineales bacterium]
MTRKIMIIDDHPLMREAFQSAFAIETDLEVVGEAANGLEALNMLAMCAPDIILIDLLMPDMDGLETIEKILKLKPDAKILVVTSIEEEDQIMAAMQAGALGYFPKSAPRKFLLEAVRKVADGAPYLPEGIAMKLLRGIRGMKKSAVNEPLTARQDEVLTLLGKGYSDAEIAARLSLEEATVRSHVHHIIQRIGVENRAQAVAYASGARKAK